MGFFDSIFGGLFGGLLSFGQNKQNYKYQTKLAEQQFGYQTQLAQQGFGYQSQLNDQLKQHQQELAAQQYGYQTQLMDKQNQFNLDMWHQTNEYNSPSAQVERLQAAGLNPAAMFGNVTSSQNLTSSSPSFGMPPASSSGFGMPSFGMPGFNSALVSSVLGMMDAVTNISKRRAETINLEEDAKLKAAQAGAVPFDVALTKARTEYQETVNKWSDLSEQERLKNLRAATTQMQSQQHLTDTQAKQIEEMLPYISKLNEAQLDKLGSDISLSLQQAATEVSKRYNLSTSAKQSLAMATYYTAAGYTQEAETELKKLQQTTEKYEAENLLQLAQKNYEDAVEGHIRNTNLKLGVDSKASAIGGLTLMTGTLGKLMSGNKSGAFSIPVAPVGSTTPPKSPDSDGLNLIKDIFKFFTSRSRKVSNPAPAGFQMGR